MSDADRNHLKIRKSQVSAGRVEYKGRFQKDLSVAGKFLTFGAEQGTSKMYLCLGVAFFSLCKAAFPSYKRVEKWRQIGFEGIWAGWKKNGLQLCQERASPTPCSGFPSATADKSWFSLAHPEPAPFPSLPDLCCLQGQLQRESFGNPWGWEGWQGRGRGREGPCRAIPGSDAFIQRKLGPRSALR